MLIISLRYRRISFRIIPDSFQDTNGENEYIKKIAAFENAVYEKISSTLESFRSKGKEEAKGITSLAERESETIIAEAYKKSQEIKGEGDAQSTQIYADAFSASPEFYSFYRSLEAYKTTFNDKSNMILLEPDSDFFKYFNDTDGVKNK